MAKADYDMRRLHLNNIPSATMSIVNGLQDFAKKRREHGSIDEAAAAAAADFLNEGFSIVLRLLARRCLISRKHYGKNWAFKG
ncbi:MAG: hypothetical protein R1F54_07335 [Candidatus Zeuxoniibacter abyssi]|nr:MAG: hypothetical protein R1F54_07335 [Candidatus Persebacteraceae bacterium AB1(2)]